MEVIYQLKFYQKKKEHPVPEIARTNMIKESRKEAGSLSDGGTATEPQKWWGMTGEKT